MNKLIVFHIGTIAFETKNSERELKSIGGIPGYIYELINFSLSKNIQIGFIGKIFNYKRKENLKYYEIQKEVVSTNKTLFNLFIRSFFIKIPKKSVIHAHRPDNLAAFIFFKKRLSVVTLHGQQAKTVGDRKSKVVRTIYNLLEKFALKKTNAIVAVDTITKEYYLSRYPQYENKLHVIPTGVNTDDFKPLNKDVLRKKMGYESYDKIILYVGRIEPPKKIDDIIKAFQLLVKQDNLYKLVLVGDGVLLKEMKNLSNDLKLDAHISFLGIRKRNELPEIFNIADISVLYSKNEGSPLSVKESLACGVPVVANNVGDVSVVIENGFNGYIVEKESVEELALKMKLAVDKSPELKQNSIDSIQNYTTKIVNKVVINLYKSILNDA